MNARPPNAPAEIELVLLDHDALALLDESREDFEAAWHIRVGEAAEAVAETADMTRQMLDACPRDVPWGAYLVADVDTREVVGTCAFKDAPSPEGEVEIAYHTYPGYEGRGYARAMAARLLDIAKSAKRVVAHTLPQQNASTRVLERLGFARAGEVRDAENGVAWRWELGAGRRGPGKPGPHRKKPHPQQAQQGQRHAQPREANGAPGGEPRKPGKRRFRHKPKPQPR
jgi:RimJ/RimL family protein N-acetyltransferase